MMQGKWKDRSHELLECYAEEEEEENQSDQSRTGE